jgi:YHS domain-containing protein
MKHLALAATVFLLACNSTKPTSEAAPETTKQAAVEATASPAPATAASSSADQKLALVADSSQVCMVNNQFMGREQIPVEVEGKTYFGCCEMCKGRLARDPSSRSAKDPVSGKLVDKASAVIGKRASGEVLYFESNDTFERYRTL